MKKVIGIFLLVLVGSAVFGQVSLYQPLGTNIASDTVTNTATAYLTSPNSLGAKQTTGVQVVCTKISGTVAGTISLLGTVDGTNYKAILLQGVSTALNTYTATDVASQTFIFMVPNNPYLKYRVSWTGSGTMAASFSAKMLSR